MDAWLHSPFISRLLETFKAKSLSRGLSALGCCYVPGGVDMMTATSTSTLVVAVMVAVVAAFVVFVATTTAALRIFPTTLFPNLGDTSFLPGKKDQCCAQDADANPSGGRSFTAKSAPVVDVKFVALKQIDWSGLNQELAAYERERHAALESLSFQLEVVKMESSTGSDREALQWLIGRIQDKTHYLSGLYEDDQQTLRGMLRPFQYSLALPPPQPTHGSTPAQAVAALTDRGSDADGSTLAGEIAAAAASSSSSSSLLDCPKDVCRKRWTAPPSDGSSASASASSAADGTAAVYSTVAQVVAHLVRDWSPDGAAIRRSLYDWCVRAVRDRAREVQGAAPAPPHDSRGDGCGPTHAATNVSVLVPGAGLGRLAYDLAASLSVDPSTADGCPACDADKVEFGLGASTGTGTGGSKVFPSSSSFTAHVHAVEPSLTMMAAAAHLFDRQEHHHHHHQQQRQAPQSGDETVPSASALILHPYASDPFTNEVDDDDDVDNDDDVEPQHPGRSSFQSQRYRAVTIEKPVEWGHEKTHTNSGSNHQPSTASPSAFLSFTVGDFASAVRAFRPAAVVAPFPPPPAASLHLHHFVVTCFFLDTASNPIEYVRLVSEALVPGGYWVNVGPLQWHVNAHLALTSRELRRLVAATGFEIVSWTVDDLPLEYRSSRLRHHHHHPRPNGSSATGAESERSSAPHSTRMEAYHPLRFVARKSPPALA
jgi:N2227-like protein